MGIVAHVNVDQHVANPLNARNIAPGAVVTDLIADTKANYDAARAVVPGAGQYISCYFARAAKDDTSYPRRCLPLVFAEREYRGDTPAGEPPGRTVDYSQPAARAELIRLLVAEAVAGGRPILFTDNWAHDSAFGGQFIPWAVTADYMRDLTAALNAKGIRSYVNVAVSIGAVPDTDVELLAKACDGVTLEMPLLPAVAQDPAMLAHAVAQYRILTSRGVDVILIPMPGGDEAEARFLAGLAMLCDVKVARPFWQAPQPWEAWPAKYGEPKGDVQQKGTTLSRRFAKGTLTIDCAKRVVN